MRGRHGPRAAVRDAQGGRDPRHHRVVGAAALRGLRRLLGGDRGGRRTDEGRGPLTRHRPVPGRCPGRPDPGQRRGEHHPDHRRPAGLPHPRPPPAGGPGTARRLSRMLVDAQTGVTIETGSTAYRPPARLQHYVRARDGTCQFPGHRVAARPAQLDHVLPWPLGQTAPDNLICLCTHHHRLKTPHPMASAPPPRREGDMDGPIRSDLPHPPRRPPPDARRLTRPPPYPQVARVETIRGARRWVTPGGVPMGTA